MFRHPLTKVSNKDMVPLLGIKKPLQIIQAFALVDT